MARGFATPASQDLTATGTQGLGAAGAAGSAAAMGQCGAAAGKERAAVLRLLTRTTSRLISGRSAELALRRRAPEGISVEEYAAVAAARTSSLLECALAGGALLAGAEERVVEVLTRAGHHLGIAVQAARDIEDLWSGTGLTGRPAMSGLREGGPSLPLIAALRAGNPAARTLAQSMGGGPACPPPPDELADLIENAGGRAAAHQISAWQLSGAYTQLDKAALRPLRTPPCAPSSGTSSPAPEPARRPADHDEGGERGRQTERHQPGGGFGGGESEGVGEGGTGFSPMPSARAPAPPSARRRPAPGAARCPPSPGLVAAPRPPSPRARRSTGGLPLAGSAAFRWPRGVKCSHCELLLGVDGAAGLAVFRLVPPP